MAILQLVDKEKISLDESIYTYFPQFSNSKDITIFHLLTHTSGVRDFEDLLSKTRKRPISDKEVLNIVSKRTPYFHPGHSWRYSNS
jgi:CubicO group peptidase (beta-lactamase class C family)